MQEHHQKTIDNFINKVKSDNKYLAVILCGSIAQGLEKKESDIDVYLVVTDDEYEKAVAELATAYFNFEVSTYEGGYIDGKIINYDFLVKAKKFGSEPTRASFIGAKVLWTKIDGLQMLIDQIPIFDETCREKKLQSFFAQVFTWGQFFYEESLAKNNLYLKQKSITETWLENNRKIIKIVSLLVISVLAILTFALIPINIFCINFPEWIVVLLSVLFCSGLVSYFIFFKTKLVTKIILPIVFAIVATGCSLFVYAFPYWNSYAFKEYDGVWLNYDEVITYKAAEEDINELKRYLKRTHPMFKNGLSQEVENEFSMSLNRLKSENKITVNDLRREIQTVLHLMGDAHTTTYNNYPNDAYLKVIPQKNFDGYSITAINGKSVKQIIDDVKPYYCYETEDWINVDLGSLATLDFLGYSEPFTYTWSNGENTIEQTYTADDFVSWNDFVEIRNGYYVPSEPKEFVYYDIDEQKSLAVLTLTQCTYNQTYINCVKEMFAEVKQKNIQNVAVDLRGNGGGNSLVGNEFVKYLPIDSYYDGSFDWRWNYITIHGNNGKIKNERSKNLAFEGNVYILTDSGSFSAAKDFAMLIQDNNFGKIVGEPPANSVNGYGDITNFRLRNTGLFVQISTKKWYRIDQTKTDDYVMPDYPCNGNDCFAKLYEIIG